MALHVVWLHNKTSNQIYFDFPYFYFSITLNYPQVQKSVCLVNIDSLLGFQYFCLSGFQIALDKSVHVNIWFCFLTLIQQTDFELNYVPTNTNLTTLSHKALYIILREPVTYKTISQTSSFILHVLYTYTDLNGGTPTYTLSPTNAHKHLHTCIDTWPPF